MVDQEAKIVSECLNLSAESELEAKSQDPIQNNEYFKKYIQLKKYLNKNEKKFIDLEQTHLKALRNMYSVLTKSQKMKLICNLNLDFTSILYRID